MNEYLIDSMSIALERLSNNENKSYRWLFENSTHIDMKVYDILNDFFVRNEVAPDNMCLCNLDCVYGEASRNYRFRFIIVGVNDDYVLVPFKIVDPRSAKIENYFTISYHPLSYNKNTESIKEVLKVLSSYECIHSIDIPSDEKGSIRNNYYNLPENYRDICRSKWKSKHGINKLSNIIDVDYHSESLIDIEDKLRDMFSMWCELRDKHPSIKDDIGTLNAAKKLSGAFVLTFTYKGKLLGITIGTPIYDNYVVVYTQKSLGVAPIEFLIEYLGEDSENVRDIQKYLGSYVQYVIHQVCFDVYHYKALFYTGDQGDKRLRDFKRKYYKNVIYYKRIPLGDYISKL